MYTKHITKCYLLIRDVMHKLNIHGDLLIYIYMYMYMYIHMHMYIYVILQHVRRVLTNSCVCAS